MIVYRFEDKEGSGIWAGYGSHLLGDHEGLWHGGRTVGGRFTGKNQRYGCESLKALKAYFGSAFWPIVASGKFKVVKYKVRKNYVEMSDIELVFDFDKAERLSDIPLEPSTRYY